MAKIQRIDPDRPLVSADQVVHRRIEPPAAVTDTVAMRERDSAVQRLVTLEREIATLKERLRLVGEIVTDWMQQSEGLNGDVTLLPEGERTYVLALLDPNQPIPAPVEAVMPEDV